MKKVMLIPALCLAFSVSAADMMDIQGTGEAAATDCMEKLAQRLEAKDSALPEDAFFEKCHKQMTTNWDAPKKPKPETVAQTAYLLGLGAAFTTLRHSFKKAADDVKELKEQMKKPAK